MQKIRTASVFFLLISLFPITGFAQEEDNHSITAKGYLKYLQTAYYPKTSDQWIFNNLIHNRLNFKWFPTTHFNAGLEVRNRLFYGDFVKLIPDYSNLIDYNNGYFGLSKVWAKSNSFVLHSAVDRAYFDLIFGKLQIRAGRQRINWSQNLVWNPNDIFNAYSYFDFDYEERPGTDAVKIQYYTSLTSIAELVCEVADKPEKMAFAGMYRLNKGGYDYQFLGGYVKDDWMLGTGWSGHIGSGAFRGEVSYFYANNDTVSKRSHFVGSISGDYTFINNLYIQLGIIYNSQGSTGKAPFPESIFYTSLSAKNLTPARTELLAQASYPITPLINGSFSGIINPLDGSFFFGPSFTFSLLDNLEFLVMGQFFEGGKGTEYGDIGSLLYWRIKWSF